MKNILSFLLIFMVLILAGCGLSSSQEAASSIGKQSDSLDRILVNQLGFYPNAVKRALIKVRVTKFDVIDVNSKKNVFSGVPGPFRYWDLSGDSVSVADFTALTTPGKYQICINDTLLCSPVFTIGNNMYTDIALKSIKAFYLNRSGMDITKEFGGEWAHAAGHADTNVIVHATAASAGRPEGFVFSSPGGWYDAGDYNKYVVNSAISTYTLMLFCQIFPDYCKSLTTNIPESSNTIPDVLDELLYNLRWMLTMQDPEDGGVYHKLTEKKFCDFVMPSEEKSARYVVVKSTAASLDFAATMAMASRLFSKNESAELKSLANTCLFAANKAYKWALAHPAIYYKNPSDISTGAYDDKNLSDEFFWAAAEIGLAENNVLLLKALNFTTNQLSLQSWDNVSMLGMISLSLSNLANASQYTNQSQKVVFSYADSLLAKAEKSPFLISLDFFKWGSNSDVANQALVKIVAYHLSSNSKYLISVQDDVDYLLGRNATGYCFVTGYGSKMVRNIHHRPSGADGIAEPYPGFLVGGPNTIVLDDCPEITRSKFPAKSYSDAQCSYSTNEVAINWNAPFFFVMGAMDALNMAK